MAKRIFYLKKISCTYKWNLFSGEILLVSELTSDELYDLKKACEGGLKEAWGYEKKM